MKISIITVTYNSARTIQDTIDSVLSQTYKDIEYIVVDGDSSDNTIEIIKKNQKRFEGNLKWLSEPDSGIYDAMNKGIRISTGDVIGILNSDDFFTSSTIVSEIVARFFVADCDAVFGDVHYVKDSNLSLPIRYYSSSRFKRWKMRLGYMPAHPSYYVYKTIYDKYGLYSTNYKIVADFDLLLRQIFINKIKISYLDKDFVTMRLGGASSSGIKSHYTIFYEHLRVFKNNDVYSNVFLLGLRYICKIYEVFLFRIKNIVNFKKK